jgi:hypothetical protein
MKKFNEFIKEERYPEHQPMEQKSANDVAAALGKAKTNAMINHKAFREYDSFDKAYKHGVSRSGFHEVHVFPYMHNIHKTEEGHIRPTTMLKFHFKAGGAVSQVHKFIRSEKPSEEEKQRHGTDWKFVKTYHKQERD